MVTVTWKCACCGMSSPLLCLFRILIILLTFEWINDLWSFFKTQRTCRASGKPPLGQHGHASVGFPSALHAAGFFLYTSFLVPSMRNLCLSQFLNFSGRLCFILHWKNRVLWAGPPGPPTSMSRPTFNKNFHLPFQHPDQDSACNGQWAEFLLLPVSVRPTSLQWFLHF